ncbi:MAG: type II toxin-antitoxin system HicB family antitoxin [Desulfobacterales bacterium]
MSNFLIYKDYFGIVEYSANDRIFWGKIEFINDSITFETANADDLEKEFRDAVDDYLDTCKKIGKKPEKSFKGQFNVRINPELHKKAAEEALHKKISLDKFIENAISRELTINASSA